MRKIDLFTIKEFADRICHCGDYGQTYISKDLKSVTIIFGDGDTYDTEEFEEYLQSIGVKLNVECESSGKNGILISNGTIGELDDFDDIIEEESVPQLLSLEQYSDYLRLMKRLAD